MMASALNWSAALLGALINCAWFGSLKLSRITMQSAQITGILSLIAANVGVDPIQFAVVFLVGASIGFITPPYGLNVNFASGVTGVPYFRLLRYSTMYLFASITVWFMVALFPSISKTLLPGGGIFELIQAVFASGAAAA